MTDVVFLLLIFFMVATQFVSNTKQIRIELPKAKGGETQQTKRQYKIEITKDKRIFLNGKEITLTQLDLLLQADKNIPNRSATIRADKRLNYGFVIKVLGILKANGVESIGISVISGT